MNQKVVWGLIALFTVILAVLVWWYVFAKPKVAVEGTVLYCGGFANVTCPLGQECKLSGSNPDATGHCVEE